MSGEAMVGLIGAAAVVLMIALSFWVRDSKPEPTWLDRMGADRRRDGRYDVDA